VTDLYQLHHAVLAALRTRKAREWRDHYFPMSSRWDDGPCHHVASAIREIEGEGELVWVQSHYHCMYHRQGLLLDGHEIIPDSVYKDDMRPNTHPHTTHPIGDLVDAIRRQLVLHLRKVAA